MDYFADLNEKQREAVEATEGPLLIVAGAGAGKTKTLTSRIINLIKKGIAPNEILAVTFTNKAAKEMRERIMDSLKKIDKFSGYGPGLPFVGTFHSLGVLIIKENAREVGVTQHFTILDQSDSVSIAREAMNSLGIDPKKYDPKRIRGIISKQKGEGVSVSEFREGESSTIGKIIGSVWRKYEELKAKENSLDFDDLLLKSMNLLEKNLDIRQKYQERFKYLHIDEYQDTNEVQYKMAKLLCSPEKNICVVGDGDQNIYSWRGANLKNILNFEKEYPDATVVFLEENYRSTKNIITASNAIIKKNIHRKDKNLFTKKGEGEKVSLIECYDEAEEASAIGDRVEALMESGVDPKEIAVLYRANFQSRVIEEEMLSRNLPYTVLGVRFFERKEVKDLLSYLRAARSPESLSDIKRIINVPARGIGKATLAKLFANMQNELPASMQIKINKFYKTLEEIKNFSETNSASAVIKFAIQKSGIEESLKNGGEEDLERLENLGELVTLSTKYDGLEDGLSKLLEDAALASDQDAILIDEGKKKDSAVKLMTVHAAKGLEFDYVFVSGLEQDLFPHSKASEAVNEEEREEERRLFYVAITRARKKLYLSFASLRTIYGSRQINTPSEFLYDIPEEVLERESTNRTKIIHI